jgi:hypothetical protein
MSSELRRTPERAATLGLVTRASENRMYVARRPHRDGRNP